MDSGRTNLEAELADAWARIDSLERELAAQTTEIERVTQDLDSLTYGVSHDLRSPLRAIDGFTRILEEDYSPQLDTEGRRHVVIIREAAKKLDRSIEGLVLLARISRHCSRQEEVDMFSLARVATEEVRRGRSDREASVTIQMMPPTLGDPALLLQLWLRLIDNAFKFTDRTHTARKEPRNIEIGSVPEANAPTYYIRENGVGFDMRYADKLFKVFQRLHGDREFSGDGIGLALAQRIVACHGGRIWAEAARDQGACFYFCLSADGLPVSGR